MSVSTVVQRIPQELGRQGIEGTKVETEVERSSAVCPLGY